MKLWGVPYICHHEHVLHSYKRYILARRFRVESTIEDNIVVVYSMFGSITKNETSIEHLKVKVNQQ